MIKFSETLLKLGGGVPVEFQHQKNREKKNKTFHVSAMLTTAGGTHDYKALFRVCRSGCVCDSSSVEQMS